MQGSFFILQKIKADGTLLLNTQLSKAKTLQQFHSHQKTKKIVFLPSLLLHLIIIKQVTTKRETERAKRCWQSAVSMLKKNNRSTPHTMQQSSSLILLPLQVHLPFLFQSREDGVLFFLLRCCYVSDMVHGQWMYE